MSVFSDDMVRIKENISSDTRLREKIKIFKDKVNNRTATYDDAVKLSKYVGDITSEYLVRNGLPDELLGEWAQDVIVPLYRDLQGTSLTAAEQVQEIFNQQMGIGLNPADVNPDSSRLLHIAKRFEEATEGSEVSFLLGKDVAENIAWGAVNDSMRQNARQMSSAGLETYVTRKGGASCCPWCASISGTYALNDLPDDFWAVHKDCTCSFEYKSRNSHTRITYSTGKRGGLIKNTENI